MLGKKIGKTITRGRIYRDKSCKKMLREVSFVEENKVMIQFRCNEKKISTTSASFHPPHLPSASTISENLCKPEDPLRAILCSHNLDAHASHV